MRHEINLEQYHIEKRYVRNGKSCFFDPIREMLIVETPEENVRQKIIQFIQDKMNVPANKIEVEVPMCHFQKGAKGRADIIVYGEDSEGELVPAVVVECKAPSIPMTDDVFNQAVRYNQILNSDNIITTNGNLFTIWSWDYDEENYRELLEVPKYEEIVKSHKLVFDNREIEYWHRPDFNQISSEKVAKEFYNFGWIGEDTPLIMRSFLINLSGFFQDEDYKISAQSLGGVKIIEDGGTRNTSFGNVAGGIWNGDYRYFIIEDEQGNNQIISIMVSGSLKCENHPKFGNRRGISTLIVAIDDFNKSHNSLQLNLDDYIKIRKNVYTIWHDGKMTAGKSGACKKSEVLNFIRKMEPDLIGPDGNIFLGSFDNSQEISWNQASTKEFVGRLIKYALVRDKFRKYKSES